MTTATIEPRPPHAPLALAPRPFGAIPRAEWERLHAATTSATPFSRWTFHRAWWDAYADTAEDHYLVLDEVGSAADRGGDGAGDRAPAAPHEADRAAAPLRAVVPLMVREQSPEGRTLFMGASYHADYATILAEPADLPGTVAALASALVPSSDGTLAWDVTAVDLRRLRRHDPMVALLAAALRAAFGHDAWQVERVGEDVCPVLELASDWEAQLAMMSRSARHELRRKLRRADRTGAIRLRHLPLEPSSVERFIELHQARWGETGLFADTADGERSRTFLHRLAELEAAAGPAAQLQLMEVTVGDRVISAAVTFDDGTTCYFYNAGMEPTARDLSPGVIGTAMLIRDRLEAGTRRFDFLRGDEPYKYEWGAVDEAIDQVVVRRRT